MSRNPPLLFMGAVACLCSLTPNLRSEPAADPEAGASAEFEAMRAGFGLMETVAGALNSVDRRNATCNDWLSVYEGADANLVDLSRPHMAVADEEGNIYIADKEGFTIRKVTLDGKIKTVAGNGLRGESSTNGVATSLSLREPNGVYAFPDGCFYLLEIDDLCSRPPEVIVPGGTIRKVDADGMMTIVVDDDGLLAGRGLWVSPDESLIIYCSGTEVKKWTESGGIEVLATGFVNLGNLDVAADGSIYVTDRFGYRVYKLSPDGSERTVIAGTGSPSGGNLNDGVLATSKALNEVRGIALRPDGSFFVCSHRSGQVMYVDTAGLIWLLINGNASKNTHAGDGEDLTTMQAKISEPRAITIAPNGDLIITENDRGFVRRVTNVCVEPEVLDVRYEEGGGVNLTWRSHRQAGYLIEESRNLIDWMPVSEPETSAGSATTALVGGDDGSSYFRVREVD